MKSIFRLRPAKAVLKGKIFFAYSPREKSNNVKKIEKILVERGAELSFFLNKRVKCIYGYHIDNNNQRKCINASKPISSNYCSAMTVENSSKNFCSGKLLDTMLDSDLIIWHRLSCQFRMFYLFIYLASPIITQTNNTYTQTFLSNPKTRKLQRNVHDCKIKPRTVQFYNHTHAFNMFEIL